MTAELATAWTADGLRLDGLFEPPLHAPRRTPPIFAAVLLHGVGSNFYGSTLFEAVTPALHECGVAVLRANTRGHDAMCTVQTRQGGRIQGAAYETVDESRFDIAAWIDWLAERGWRRIGLFGHSLGAVKAVYAQAREPSPLVRRIAAFSPPRLARSAFEDDPQNAPYREAILRARALVDAGQRDSLISVSYPLPLLLSAATYLDKYGADRYDLLELAPQLKVPTLFTYGSRELSGQGAAFEQLEQRLRSALAANTAMAVRVIEGANHVYSGCREELARTLTAWLLEEPA